MKTQFNSASVRNEVIEMQANDNQSINTNVSPRKPIDKGVIALIAFFTTLVTVAIVISSLGLTSNAY